MATIKSFEDIVAWQKARALDAEVFSMVTSSKKFSVDFSLKDQVLRSSGSIMDNIAEGFERGGKREFIHFLSIAKASCGELRSQLYRACDRQYVTDQTFKKVYDLCVEESKIINGLMSYLRKTEIKGIKFKEDNTSLKSATLN